MAERILVVEDDRELREFLVEVLVGAGHDVCAVSSGGRALIELRREEPLSVVVTDLVMPGMGGRELLDDVRTLRPELNVIVITAFGTIESAIELVKAGAFDYLTKPFGTEEFLLTVERALEESRLRREAVEASRGSDPLPGFVGSSPAMRGLYGLIRKVASSPLPILVTGETGTGKELVARAVHSLSGRGPFVAVNCAALPESLLEAELFGHTRGAFTGAVRERTGLFLDADRGTLFLDEIGELPRSLQPKLLRALEEGEIRPVGSGQSRKVDVRIVTATNRDLLASVGTGEFREDLYWRLNGLTIPLPPLRSRGADVALLVQFFVERAARKEGTPLREISSAAMSTLAAYLWPGNVRELRNVVEAAVAVAAGTRIEVTDLPLRVQEAAGRSTAANEGDRAPSLREVEQRYIQEVLRQTDGNRSRAAEILGLDRKTLYRKLQEYDRAPNERSG